MPECRPGTFDKVSLDTTNHGPGTIQTHIRALPDPMNSELNDHAIAFLPGRNGYVAIVTSDRKTADPTEIDQGVQRMYSAPFQSTMKYGKLSLITNGSAPLPNGAAYYCSADGMLYFSAKAEDEDPDDYDLYVAKASVDAQDQITLTESRPLTALNKSTSFESQPTLDPTGTKIYFVSDRLGGHGGTDIWYSERPSLTGKWSEPRALPGPINTECDELSPFIPSFDANTLYFSSNGHATAGGYDIFKAHGSGAEFSEPENLGLPINTRYDEVFPYALNDTAFFWSSNHRGFDHGRNIFTITRERNPLTPEEQLKFKQQAERVEAEHLQQDSAIHAKEAEEQRVLATPVNVYVHVRRGQDHRPASGADLYVKRDSVELYRGTVPASGNFLIKVRREFAYDFGAELEETFFDVEHLDLHGFKDTAAEVNLYLPDTLILRINFPFDDYTHPYQFVVNDDGTSSTMTWNEALDLTAHSAIRSLANLRQLLVTGHTDSLGSDQYNDRLGFRRATFIASELEKRGVPRSIMKIASEGRTQPVSKRPGESDEIFRLRSRRVEFVKVFK